MNSQLLEKIVREEVRRTLKEAVNLQRGERALDYYDPVEDRPKARSLQKTAIQHGGDDVKKMSYLALAAERLLGRPATLVGSSSKNPTQTVERFIRLGIGAGRKNLPQSLVVKDQGGRDIKGTIQLGTWQAGKETPDGSFVVGVGIRFRGAIFLTPFAGQRKIYSLRPF